MIPSGWVQCRTGIVYVIGDHHSGVSFIRRVHTVKMGYTASDAFFEALWEAGIRFCFVNLGSDHPSLVEAILKGQKERPNEFPKVITCPNEMVALAMADGYARWTGKPQAVIVHVDVGTQGLAAAIHDSSTGRAPVFIFAGLSPVTLEGEARGSRTEYIHWLQDVPDQKQIVSQYCRYAGEVKVGQNVKQMVNRALSFAMSAPQGPVYLVGCREVMEQEIKPYSLNQNFWHPVEPLALPTSGVQSICQHLAEAENPLLIVGASGRRHESIEHIVHLADMIPHLQVLDCAGSDMSFPANHPAWLGTRYGVHPAIRSADVIVVIECDVPWIPVHCRPKADAMVFHIDTDPLKQLMPVFYIDAHARYRADPATALAQLTEGIKERVSLLSTKFSERQSARRAIYEQRLQEIHAAAEPSSDSSYGPDHLMARVRAAVPEDTVWVVEAVTVTGAVADQVQATRPGSYVNCGGGGLGWSGGAALGIKLATKTEGKPAFVVQVVGDGTFIFSVPSAVYWIAQRYGLPTLTIVLNNKGWNAPKRSALLVHPDGLASRSTNEEINISFAPGPDYAGVAKAAAGGRLWAGRTSKASELDTLLAQAVQSVKDGVGAVFEAQLDGPEGKYAGVPVEASGG